MLTVTQQAELRRFMGYPALGQPVSSNPPLASMASGFRFLDPIGNFEIRIQTLTQDEEVQCFGAEHDEFSTYALVGGVSSAPGIRWQNTDGSWVYGYIPTLRILEADLVQSRRFLGYLKAKVVDFSQNEMTKRRNLYNAYRQDLSNLLAMPLDPDVLKKRRTSTFRFR